MNDNLENVSSFPGADPSKRKAGSLGRIFDTRDPSIIPLQIILFALACLELVQGLIKIINPPDSVAPHVYAHLGSYMLAYACALFAIAFRPARARGLFVLVTAATFGFVLTAIIDIINGTADFGGELEHITKLIVPFIVWIIAARVSSFSRIPKK